MRQEECLTFYINALWLVVHDNAALPGEVVFAPDIMVAGEEVYGYAGIGQLGQFAQQTGVALGNGIAVLEPEVEYIAQHVQALGLWLYLIQETAQVLLLLQWILRCATPQMCIGYEKCLFQLVDS